MNLVQSNVEPRYTVILTINNNKFLKINQKDKNFVLEELYIKYIDFFFCVEIVQFINNYFNYLVEYQNNYFDIINDKNNGNGKSCLMFACVQGDLNIINFLVRIGANINEKDNLGRSCLMIACVECDYDVAEFLLLNGANINDSDINGVNCLMFACDKGNLDIVELLLDNGANINDIDSNGSNCLMYAIKSEIYLGNSILNITKLLLAKGINIHETNNLNETIFSLGEFMRWNSVLYSIRKWPTSMFAIVLEELGLEGFMDNSSLVDFHQYMGKEDFTLDNEEDYGKDADGDIIDFVYETDSDDENENEA
jgi:hypothetical protein